ncbi:hypothetical protein [Tuwongella immobilis]|uniref:Uncharacterized protein n=1 Tax=Tuwongella immobilis TaxID=692036 RepID=A0A6C2YQP1_9BACT|nr:hypothetical protein [Tuwongella immobilis]VIP03714.1 unnamed protein product [Tuwongella immobilis]VTS04796.1 unnamed protein product [Tuwongella immobilis]
MRQWFLFVFVGLMIGDPLLARCSASDVNSPNSTRKIPPATLVKSSVEFGEPIQVPGDPMITLPMKLTLGTHASSYDGYAVRIETDREDGQQGPEVVQHFNPAYAAPAPGQTVTVNITFKFVSGKKYQASGSMQFKNGKKAPQIERTPVTTKTFIAD